MFNNKFIMLPGLKHVGNKRVSSFEAIAKERNGGVYQMFAVADPKPFIFRRQCDTKTIMHVRCQFFACGLMLVDGCTPPCIIIALAL